MASRFYLSKRDVFAFLEHLPDASVDLIATDPPYESLEKHRARGTTTRLKHSKASSNDWFSVIPNTVFPRMLSEFWRVLKPNRHCYIFCDAETSDVIKLLVDGIPGFPSSVLDRVESESSPYVRALVEGMAKRRKFTWWKRVVWDKCAIGMGYHYRNQHEFIVFLEKGKRKLNDLGKGDVIEAKRVHRGYPTQKPVEVNEILISQSTQDGELVCDPFLGSGSAGAASVNLQRDFCGNDVCKEALLVSRDRLREGGGIRVNSFLELS